MLEHEDAATTAVPNNRQFKANPRLLVAAQDMHDTAHDGRRSARISTRCSTTLGAVPKAAA